MPTYSLRIERKVPERRRKTSERTGKVGEELRLLVQERTIIPSQGTPQKKKGIRKMNWIQDSRDSCFFVLNSERRRTHPPGSGTSVSQSFYPTHKNQQDRLGVDPLKATTPVVTPSSLPLKPRREGGDLTLGSGGPERRGR